MRERDRIQSSTIEYPCDLVSPEIYSYCSCFLCFLCALSHTDLCDSFLFVLKFENSPKKMSQSLNDNIA